MGTVAGDAASLLCPGPASAGRSAPGGQAFPVAGPLRHIKVPPFLEVPLLCPCHWSLQGL